LLLDVEGYDSVRFGDAICLALAMNEMKKVIFAA
jgi:hypothetical protein